MNAWPPKPGWTVITRTWSSSPSHGSIASNGVSGLIARPTPSPSPRISASRSAVLSTSTWTLIQSAPAWAKAERNSPGVGHHQVAIERHRGVAVDGRDDRWPDRQVRDEVAVHDVDVEDVGDRLHARDGVAQRGEVGGEDRRCDLDPSLRRGHDRRVYGRPRSTRNMPSVPVTCGSTARPRPTRLPRRPRRWQRHQLGVARRRATRRSRSSRRRSACTRCRRASRPAPPARPRPRAAAAAGRRGCRRRPARSASGRPGGGEARRAPSTVHRRGPGRRHPGRSGGPCRPQRRRGPRPHRAWPRSRRASRARVGRTSSAATSAAPAPAMRRRLATRRGAQIDHPLPGRTSTAAATHWLARSWT